MITNKQKWNPQDQLLYLDEFLELYNSRPIQDNTGGMKSAHMFNAWYIIKKLQPKYIIESGVWKGQGTWFFEKASPDSLLISIDPMPQFREITIPRAQYIAHDFTTIDWIQSIDTSQALVFFDDHQSCIERVKHCLNLKFIYIMFEDNYPWDQGDCYSPKKILSKKPYIIDKNNNRAIFEHNLNGYDLLNNNINIYQEMPPIFNDSKTRWNCDWITKYSTPQPLLSYNDKSKYELFYQERLDYTWICYIQLLKQ